MATPKTGFWQCALDRALLLYILSVLALWLAHHSHVLCLDWGKVFTTAGILSFLSVVATALVYALTDKPEPTLLAGKAGGK